MSNTVDINGGSHGVPVGGGAGQLGPSTILAAPGAVPVVGGGLDWVPERIIGQCFHVKADGEWCGRLPKKGDKYCPLHRSAGMAIDIIDEALDESE